MDAQNCAKENKHNERETNQNITTLVELEKLLTKKISVLEKINHELEKDLAREKHDLRESKQQAEIFKSITNLIQNKNATLEHKKNELEKLHSTNHTKLKELTQEKEIFNELRHSQKTKTQKLEKKYYFTIATAGVILTAIFVSYSFFALSLIGVDHRVVISEPVKSGYVIQNLKGDTIDTWLSWRLVDGEILHINIVNGKKYQERLHVIKDAILSIESIEIDDSLLHKGPKGSTSLFYMGWAGALEAASKVYTEYRIPNRLEVIESGKGEGDITIELTNMKNGDGYTGYTRTIADEGQNQILKSHITIYEIESLSDNDLRTIMRHELAHALGLAHASAPEDLMYPTIQTEFPYISECDIDALIHLYDGGKTSQVVCEK